MKILIDIGHPAQVHFFKCLIWNLQNRGHEIYVTLRNNDHAEELLQFYKIPFTKIIDQNYNSILKKAIGIPIIDFKLYKVAKKINPDVLISETGYVSHIGKLLQKPSLLICQNEHARLENIIFLPFAKKIITFSSYQKDHYRSKRISLRGLFFQPALSNQYFSPEAKYLEHLGLTPNDKYFILRFSDWSAAHDFGNNGINFSDKAKIVNYLNQRGKVFISSESELPNEFKTYKLDISPESFHSVLNYASLFIGEGASTAAEAAILGVPSIYYSTISLGYIEMLKNDYHLLYTVSSIENCLEILATISLSKNTENAQKLLDESDDIIQSITEIIEEFLSELS